MINVLIADNQTLTREGVISVLSAIEGIEIIAEIANPAELSHMILNHMPDVVIIDQLAISDIKTISDYFDIAHLLILSNKRQKNEMLEVIDLGIKNYISKDCSREELINAVYAAAKGKQFFCKSILNELYGNNLPEKAIDNIPSLSSRETEIVHMIAEGLTNKDIAERLFLSIHTVKTHRKNIIKKLGFSFKNAAELVLLTGLK